LFHAGKRISLISKKNIRYEGLLYSINEQNATVALQNVRSYGTEGREQDNEGKPLVGPSDDVHPYLLFRGQDIKDLPVHDETPQVIPSQPPPPVVAVDSTDESKVTSLDTINAIDDRPNQTQLPTAQQEQSNDVETGELTNNSGKEDGDDADDSRQQNSQKPRDDSSKRPKQLPGRGGGGGGKGGSGPKTKRRSTDRGGADPPAIGTGASLLGRKARGVVKDSDINPSEEFDFQSNFLQLQEEEQKESDESGDAIGPDPSIQSSTQKANVYYDKDSFFDSISCDALDKEQGVDNRLRGTAERQLNTETFGAVALNANNNSYRGRGRRGGTGRSNGGYMGRGRSRGDGNANTTGNGRGGRGDGSGGRDGNRGRVSRGRGRGRGRTARGRQNERREEVAAL
jgi:protein LSM14